MIDKKECILGISKKPHNEGFGSEITLYKLSKFAENWQIETQKIIINDSFAYNDLYRNLEFVTLNNTPFLYFIYKQRQAGNAITFEDIYFSLCSLNDFTVTTLDYQCDGNFDTSSRNIKGHFIISDDLKQKKELLTYLEKTAAQSPLIYHPTEHDHEVNLTENYAKKWQIDNANVKTVWSVNDNTLEEAMVFTYYTAEEKAFSISDNPDDENNFYAIYITKGDEIIGYDKLIKKWFPIWIQALHGTGIDYIMSAQLIEEHILQICWCETRYRPKIIIDLKKSTYKISLSDNDPARNIYSEPATAATNNLNTGVKPAQNQGSDINAESTEAINGLHTLIEAQDKIRNEDIKGEEDPDNLTNPCKLYRHRVGTLNSYRVIYQMYIDYFSRHPITTNGSINMHKNSFERGLTNTIHVMEQKVQYAKQACY